MEKIWSFILLFLPFQIVMGQSIETIQTFPAGYEVFQIDSSLRVWVDSSQEATIEEVRQARNQFIPFNQMTENLVTNVDFWGWIRVKNTLEDSISLIWATGRGDFIELYHFKDGKEILHEKGGLQEKVSQRNIKVGEGDAFSIILAPGEIQELFLKKHEKEGRGPHIEALMYTRPRFAEHFYSGAFQSVGLLNTFYGILSIIIIYNLIIGFSTREWLYFFYSLYLFSIGYTIFLENTVHFFPKLGFNDPFINNLFVFFFFSLTSTSYFQFGRLFLHTKSITPKWDKAIKIIMLIRLGIVTVGIIWNLLHYFSPTIPESIDDFFGIVLILMGIEAVFMFIFFFPLVKAKSPVGWFFVAGSTLVFLVGFVGILLQNFLDVNFFIHILISIVLEILVFSLGLGYKFRKSERDKLEAEKALNMELSKVNTAFGRFVPHEFLESLGHETVTQVKLGDQVEKEVTVFFSDIRGYTSLSESMTPQENFLFLNAYLGRVGPIIKEENGFVNQYYGDGIMAIFMKSASDAVQSAVQIQQTLWAYNVERKQKERQAIKIGIGLHTGPLMMGIIGDQLRMDAAVVSDTVNTASRMEGLTKHYGAELILSETVLSQLPEDHPFQLRYLGKVLVKGRKQPLGIYECLDAVNPTVRNAKLESRDDFEKALNAYFNRNFADACTYFQALVSQYDGDVAAKFYLEKAKMYLMDGVAENWNGVETMMSK